MNDELKENIKSLVQRTVPFLLSLFFVLFGYVPASLGGSADLRPAAGMICVFYWVLHRSDLFNMFSVFFLALIADFLSSAPLGAEIISYLTVYVCVSNLSKFFTNKPFLLVWYGFAFVFTAAEVLKWFLLSVYYAEFLPLLPLFFMIFCTIACYPVIGFVNDMAQRYLINDEG